MSCARSTSSLRQRTTEFSSPTRLSTGEPSSRDKGIHAIAIDHLKAGKPFRMVFWRLERHRKMSDGDFVRAFENIANKPSAFTYPIEYIKPDL